MSQKCFLHIFERPANWNEEIGKYIATLRRNFPVLPINLPKAGIRFVQPYINPRQYIFISFLRKISC